MKTVLLYASSCLALLCCVIAGEPDIEIVPASNDVLESLPREIVTSVFLVTNWSTQEREIVTEADLPIGWHLLASDRDLSLKPGQRGMSLVSFLIPRTARAGTYRVGFSARSRKGAAYADSSTIMVDIMPITKLCLEVLECPEFVVAGETYEVMVAVMNQGNTTAMVEVRTASHTGFPSQRDIQPFSLPPGESIGLTLSVATDPGIRRIVQERLSITAIAMDEPETRDQAWCYLEILPRVTGAKSRFNKVPAMASVRYFNAQEGWDGDKFQASVRGSGCLDRKGDQHVDFILRGPDLGQNRLLGNRDEYFVKYRYGKQSVTLGDCSYSVSPLIENHRYGRGARVSAVLDRLAVGGYHMKSRWTEPGDEQIAGHLDYRLGEESMVGLRYLKKGTGQTDEMVSLESRLQPATDTDLELEYARTLAPEGDDSAYRLKLTTLRTWGSYLLRFIRGGADYTGYYRNMDFISTSLGLRFSRDFRCDASFRQERHNLSLDPLGFSAPLERDYRLRLLFRSGASLDYSLSYRFRESRDRFAEGMFDFRERSVRAALSQRYDGLDCYVAAEIGRTRDHLTDTTKGLERYTATLRIRPTSTQSYHGYLYYDRNGGPGGDSRSHLSMGINASLALGSSTALDAGVRSNLFEDIESENRDIFELSLRQRLFRTGEIVFRGHYTEYKNSGDTGHLTFMAEYRMPFGLPVSRRDEFGALKGRVYNEETGLPLEDVILRLGGATAVTDRAGRFDFPLLPVGTHHLTIDRSSIGLDRIPRYRFPMEIRIQGGKTASTDIPVVRGATITGRIDLLAYEDSTSGMLTPDSRRRLKRVGGLANTMIELTNGSEIKRLLTARDGIFTVHELRPGSWTLAIPVEQLPDYYRVADTDLRYNLEPGKTETVAIRIVPRDRPVHILEDGGTLTDPH